MLTIKEATDVLVNRKDHWSHEIADAEQYAVDLLIAIGNSKLLGDSSRILLESILKEKL